MSEHLSVRIKRDMALIDELFIAYADLLAQVKQSTPDLIQITALASVLHSFYNGLESIFATIIKEIDGEPPSGNRWHRDLLDNMGTANKRRTAVLSPELSTQLQNYVAFRHYYRHAYSFFLRWEELRELILPLEGVWVQTKIELSRFLKTAAK